MPRTDLLALTPDDLDAITDRGTVKRAERELEAGSPTCTIDEPEVGDLVVTWTDGIVCRFPAGKVVHDAVCSSGIAGISRHVVRSVLAYQRHCAGHAGAAAPDESALGEETSGEGTAPPPAAPVLTRSVWDPATFTDDDLVARSRAAAFAKARRRFEEGVLVELVWGEKPIARFLDEPCTLCVVFDDGSRRTGLQPWIAPAPAQNASFSIDQAAGGGIEDSLESFFAQVQFELSELLLSCLRRSSFRAATAWSDLALQPQRTGFARLVKPLADLAGLLAHKAESPRWDPAPASRSVLRLCMCSRVSPYRNLRDRTLRGESIFVTEGPVLTRRLLESRFEAESVFVSEEHAEEFSELVPDGVPLYVARASLLMEIAGFPFHLGVLAAGRRKESPEMEELLGDDAAATLRLVVLPEVTKPENLGLAFRSAAAFGIDAVVLGERTCDPFSRRALRVSMGGVFQVPWTRSKEILADLRRIRDHWGVELAAAVLDKDAERLPEVRWPARAAVLLGNETEGICSPWLTLADRRVTIPMHPGVDSLNLGVAAGVLLYAMTRMV